LEKYQGWITIAIYFLLFVGIFYFFAVRPRKSQEKQHKALLESLKKGDKAVTIGGIKGTITRIKEDTVVMKVADNTEIEFLKRAIAYKTEDE